VGGGLGALAGTGAAQRDDSPPKPWIEAAHLPPLLTTADERVELRYDAFCFTETNVDEPCDVHATVHVRRDDSGAFREIPVTEDRGSPDGRFVATVPPSLARSPAGFSYYAVLRDARTGATTTLPAGGAEAPQRSRPLDRPIEISLGAHRFDAARRASARVLAAPWGSGAGAVGLEPGRHLTPVGGSSFDVAPDGTVHVLDEANRRVLRWRPGVLAAYALPVAIDGMIADLAVADDGTTYVLETTAAPGKPTVVRAFDGRGAARGETPLVERGSQLRVDRGGDALVLQQPSGQWMAAFEAGRPASESRQKATGRSGRPSAAAEELVVLRAGDEIRVALVDGHGARRSWRITSKSPLAEVQLAEPVGRSVVVVVRVYSDAEDEFRVLVLDQRGLVETFSVASADWAETAPLSRFRVRRSSLYQLGSTPDGLFVDRFDLEVDR
jgi:hypothetical protein